MTPRALLPAVFERCGFRQRHKKSMSKKRLFAFAQPKANSLDANINNGARRQNPNSVYAAAVPIFIRRLLEGQAITIFGDGRQTRDLIYVGDVVRANLLAAEHAAAAGQVFNVCTGHTTSVLDLVDVLREGFPGAPPPVFGPVRAGDIFASVGSPLKVESVLGFRAQTNLADGLKATVEWMS